MQTVIVEKSVSIVYNFENQKYFFDILGPCYLDSNNYMPATLLRGCLQSLGATGTKQIEYIETDYGNDDYLNNVCNAVNEDLSYDKSRTELQPDSCTSGSNSCLHSYCTMYPGGCSQGWLGYDCVNGCDNANFQGFYCKGI